MHKLLVVVFLFCSSSLFGQIEDFKNYQKQINGKTTRYYVNKYTLEREMLIDEYRKWIGLEPLEDYYKKFLFSANNPQSKYVFDLVKSTMVVDENSFQMFTKFMKELN